VIARVRAALVMTITASSFFLSFTFLGFDFFIATLRKLKLALEAPFRAKFGTGRGFTVNETERGVVFGEVREGRVGGEIESSIGGVFRSVRVVVVVVEVPSPIGDSAEFVGTGERSEGDVGVIGGGFEWTPSVRVEGNGA
jgi:hypothetical protein